MKTNQTMRREGEERKRQTSQPFSSERDLVETFVGCLRRSNPRGWALLREMDAGVGIADLVLVPTAQSLSAVRSMRLVPLRLAPLLESSMSATIGTESAFEAMTGLSSLSAQKAIRDLARVGLLRRRRDGAFQLKSVQEPPYSHVVAIEAKLQDWGRALTQAYRNRQFATQSWVVLDQHYPLSEHAVMAFTRAHVGLATCSISGGLKIHVAAPSLPPNSPQRAWVAQAVVARSIRQTLRPLK